MDEHGMSAAQFRLDTVRDNPGGFLAELIAPDLRDALAALRRIWAVYLDDESGGCWDVVDRWVLIRALTDCEPSVSRGVVYPDPTENKYKHEHTLRLDKKYWMCICGYSILADLEGADTNG